MTIIWIMVLCAIAFLVFWIIAYEKQSLAFKRYAIISLCVALTILLMWGLSFAESGRIRAENQRIYNDLVLYKEVVEETTNELVRFDYYSRVLAWNQKYREYMEEMSHPIFGVFHHNEFAETGLLYFELRK